MPTITPYKAIADDTRRHILDILRHEPLTAGAIVGRVRARPRVPCLSRPAVAKHLRLLRQSRLVTTEKRGRERVYTLNAEPLREVDDWVKQYETFWDQQLEAFKDYVESETKKENSNG